MKEENEESEINEKPRRDGRKITDRKKAEKIRDKLDRKAAESEAVGRQPGEKTAIIDSPETLTKHEIDILKSPDEIALYYRDGVLEYVKLGDRSTVEINTIRTQGADVSHNHPGGLGPSASDLELLAFSPQSLRIILKTDSGRRLFVIRPLRPIGREELKEVADKYARISERLGDNAAARLQALGLIKEDSEGMFDVEIFDV